MGYKTGSFNCKTLGKDYQRIRKIAEIIKDAEFDILALQEVMGMRTFPQLLCDLNMMSGNKYDGSEEPGYQYAFIWNKSRIKPAETDYNGIKKINAPQLYVQYKKDKSQGQKELRNNPYYGRFFPIGSGSLFIEIDIINTHIRFSKGVNDLPEERTLPLRYNEFNILAKTIYPKLADKRYGSNRPTYLILIGDYNLNLPDSGCYTSRIQEQDADFLMESSLPYKRIVTGQNQKTTLKQPQGETTPADYGLANNYDHYTIDSLRFEGTGLTSQVINTVELYCGNDENKYKKHLKEISDHMPIEVYFEPNPERRNYESIF
ncbi:MAG: hypothetical protein Q4A04_05135 [Eubacteriales bacterium]|nr:hypothetical protein [Eubacteriales bacterium]